MKYVRLGDSGLEVSPVAVGGMGFGDPTRGSHTWTLSEDASRVIIRRAVDLGINFFDTANVYSDGTGEEYVGRAIRDMLPRHEAVIATKVRGKMHPGPNGGGLSRKAIFAEVDASLGRLGVGYIDLLQIHRWDDDVPIEETLQALDDLVRAGKVLHLGASSMYAWQFAKLLFTADAHGWTRFVSMQDHYNLLNREVEREMLPLCRDQGAGLLVWSPLARGRLARPWGVETSRIASDRVGSTLYRDAEESNHEIVERVGRLSEERGVPRARIALAWLAQQPGVTAPIIGATTEIHIDDAVAALELALTADELAFLAEPYTPREVVGLELSRSRREDPPERDPRSP